MHACAMSVDDILSNATGKVFTGAVARIEREGTLVYERAFGMTRMDGFSQPIFVDTRFDLASITKPFVATLALDAVAQGLLHLDEPLTRYLPEWVRSEYDRINLRMLLSHTSGMNSGADYRELLGENIETFILHRVLVAAPGERVIYSDLGFIALGALLTRVHGCSLATLIVRLGRPTLGFRPRARERDAIPATEAETWRGRVQGFVHDEKAYLMGGAAGHAGLFGSAADVAWLGERYLAALHSRAGACLPSALVREAISEQAFDPTLRRGLGWALKTSDENSCGRMMSHSSFGHTGFVGTCIWVDPERDLQGILLTNSVYFGRFDTREIRAEFYEAMVREWGA